MLDPLRLFPDGQEAVDRAARLFAMLKNPEPPPDPRGRPQWIEWGNKEVILVGMLGSLGLWGIGHDFISEGIYFRIYWKSAAPATFQERNAACVFVCVRGTTQAIYREHQLVSLAVNGPDYHWIGTG